MFRWTQRFYLVKTEREGFKAFHAGKKREDNPYNEDSENWGELFDCNRWNSGWNNAFMWNAARHNLPEYQDWNRETKEKLKKKGGLGWIFLALFMSCPRSLRFGWEKVMFPGVVIVFFSLLLQSLFTKKKEG